MGESNQVKVVDGKEVAPIPKNLSVVEVLKNKVRLSWEKVEEAIDYIIYQKTNLSLFKVIGTTRETSFSDKQIHTSAEFIYAVAARTTSGITEKATVTAAPVAPVLRRKM